ncbi:MAG: copper resistance system multicopper oxidase [Caulobacteraceae bacterium]|nr:copper resistance system multicopper oxidase [Caulobacteraceae bacterium]
MSVRSHDQPPANADRRRFVQGLAVAGFVGGLGTTRAVAGPGAPSVDLTIAPSLVNITGRPRIATAVNGGLPGPTLRFREGDEAVIRVTNRLAEPTSIHWHGLRLPADQDGVPGLSFAGIMPGESFTYRFPVRQAGTYWYHGHSGMQEQTGLLGALILEPEAHNPVADREHVIILSDWTDADPMGILSNLKQQGDYYNYGRITLGDRLRQAKAQGAKATLADAAQWGRMRMSPTDILDVTGATYTYLVNGAAPAANWTGLFTPGERVRLRLINGAAMTLFDLRIEGLMLSVVAADGSDVAPVEVEELRIAPGETYDLIVQPKEDRAYTLFAQAQDRSGYARATLAPRHGMSAPIPPLDPRPRRTMTDMGMAGMADMAGMDMAAMKAMPGMKTDELTAREAEKLKKMPDVDNVAMAPASRLAEAGGGLDGDDRRALTYADLKTLAPGPNLVPTRDIRLHLTGNMERWTWGFDGVRFSRAEPIRVALGETVRFVLINDTMMEHPVHLHGFLFQVENGQDGALPWKHTLTLKPGEQASFLVHADTPGHWAFHCHLMLHMGLGMFRTVVVA